ncbi:MAG: heme ABC exporter ATP-binding protein CcmA [Pirellulaceae bacterium]|nr:heme ABC exporter ATP-binding protein CcmA [Planctomycetales bacterium]
MFAIEATNISHRLAGEWILQETDFRLTANECIVITGANGAGKTTLLRLLSGSMRPTSGNVTWYGHSDAREIQVRRLIGYVAHEVQLYPQLTVAENLLFAARMCGIADPRRRALQTLDVSGLAASADEMVAKTSRGIRQRLAIARATIHEPTIVLLDEPFTSLDQEGCQWLTESIRKWRRAGRAICVVSHDLTLTRRLATHVVRVNDRKVCDVTPASVDNFAPNHFVADAA